MKTLLFLLLHNLRCHTHHSVTLPLCHYRAPAVVALTATLVLFLLSSITTGAAAAQDTSAEESTFRLLGLFMKVRVAAFQKAMAEVEDLDVASVSYETGEVTLRLRGPFRLQNDDHEKQLRALNNRVRIGTRGAFELAPPQPKPLSKRTKIEIPIKGHDCLGCSFGAYRAVYKLKGVHRVTSDFGEASLTAWIEPKVTDRETLEAELLKRKVMLADTKSE